MTCLIVSTGIVMADDLDDLRRAVSSYQDQHMCPPRGIYNTLRFEDYCKSFCDKGWTCRGNKETDPCQQDETSDACHQFAQGTQQCLEDMNDKNSVISNYNQIVNQCHKQETDSAPAANSKKPAGAALLGASQQAQQKADEAKAKANKALLEAKEKEEQRRKEQETNSAEIAALKQKANQPSAACQNAVAACEQRSSALADLTSGTQSQCRTYCRNMQVENCNPDSPTLRQGAEACAAAQQQDRASAVARAREDRARREAEKAAEAAKLHCYGEQGNISVGFRQCEAACAAYYNSNFCHDQCYASGDNSISNGRSCFREP